MNAIIARLPDVWPLAGWTLLHTLWVGALVWAVAAIGLAVLRPAAPAVRYWFALVALLLIAVAPIAIGARFVKSIPAAPPSSAVVDGAPLEGAKETTLSLPAEAVDSSISVAAPPTQFSAAGVWNWAERMVAPICPYLSWFWLAGSIVTLAWSMLGVAGAERLRRGSQPCDDASIQALCHTLAERLGSRALVAVAVSHRVASPILLGILRPLILLPPSLATGMGIDELELVLLHELAHVGRHDNLVNLVQRLVESLLFFHPAVWWLSARVRQERELCCDSVVIRHTARPQAYAETLARLAMPGLPAQAACAAMAQHHLAARIRYILNLEDRSMRLSRNVLAWVIVPLCLAGVLVVARAQQPSVPRGASSPAADRTTTTPPTDRSAGVFLPGFSDQSDADLEIDVLKEQVKAADWNLSVAHAEELATARRLESLTTMNAGPAVPDSAIDQAEHNLLCARQRVMEAEFGRHRAERILARARYNRDKRTGSADRRPHLRGFGSNQSQTTTRQPSAVPVPAPLVNFRQTATVHWSPEQATGTPNTPNGGDYPTAWASATPDGQVEWLDLSFAPAEAVAVIVFESYNPGAVTKIELNGAGPSHTVYEGKAEVSKQERRVVVHPFASKKVESVRLTLDSPAVPGWNEIDAVGLIGSDGTVRWATGAKASSTFASVLASVQTSMVEPASHDYSAARIKELETEVRKLQDTLNDRRRAGRTMSDERGGVPVPITIQDLKTGELRTELRPLPAESSGSAGAPQPGQAPPIPPSKAEAPAPEPTKKF